MNASQFLQGTYNGAAFNMDFRSKNRYAIFQCIIWTRAHKNGRLERVTPIEAIVRAEFPASTKNRTLVTCTLGNINILRSLRSACYYFLYWREIPPCSDFYVVTRSYSSQPPVLMRSCLDSLPLAAVYTAVSGEA